MLSHESSTRDGHNVSYHNHQMLSCCPSCFPILHELNNFFLEYNAIGSLWQGKNNFVWRNTWTTSQPFLVQWDKILFRPWDYLEGETFRIVNSLTLNLYFTYSFGPWDYSVSWYYSTISVLVGSYVFALLVFFPRNSTWATTNDLSLFVTCCCRMKLNLISREPQQLSPCHNRSRDI
jgi:hypothetical protein